MLSTWFGVVLLFAFFGLLVWVIVAASPRGNTYEKKRAKARAEKLDAAQKESLNALTTYGWVDKSKGVARIPINNAMEMTIAELAQKKPAPANPIAAAEQSPAPAASPAASPSASPAASVSTTPKPTSVTGPDSESRNQPAAAIVPPPAPPNTQPGPGTTPAASPPSAAVKPPVSPAASASPTAHGTPLPIRGKTP
ncbi:MAG: hypothetical protein V7609_3497 [Verrucomicrobiota bacterium]